MLYTCNDYQERPNYLTKQVNELPITFDMAKLFNKTKKNFLDLSSIKIDLLLTENILSS